MFSVQDIIQTLIETHTTYPLKNEYSKQKYKKRKEAKCVLSFFITCRKLDYI